MISSALFAHGIRIFGLHPEDGSPQGIFCANGQCSQCMVIADGRPVKSCMVPVREGMRIHKLVNYPAVPEISGALELNDIEELSCDLLVIGAGPSGLGAAIEAADAGLAVLVVDDKDELGGKLVLQTHTFFGSVDQCYAGTRGIDIGEILAAEAEKRSNIRIMTSTMAVGVYSDSKVGVVQGNRYTLIKPQSLLVAAGAREKALVFPGCELPGVYGAGAFQTLLNRDLVAPSEKLFIVGGGNVGLIAAYHAMQAQIDVVGLIEGLPEVGGYWVHADKIRRLGVPIYTSTTVVSANGKDAIESVTVAEVDEKWNIIPGTYRTYPCDTLLIAVGLESINELYLAAEKFGMKTYVAGDAEEIAEASAAMFSGRITGRTIAADHGKKVEVPEEWRKMTRVLKSHPGRDSFPVIVPDIEDGVFPILRCIETIPCNPCMEVCPHDLIRMPEGGSILSQPEFSGDCRECNKCVAACPGLAITLVDMRKRVEGKARVTIPYELAVDFVVGDTLTAVGFKGEELCPGKVVEIQEQGALAPCSASCPAGVHVQGYIELIGKRRYADAIELLRRDLPLPSVCGRVCYQPCQANCTRASIDEPSAILELKRFVSDWALEKDEEVRPMPVTRKERVAVVGSGPAGLACANDLLRRGYPVTIFEAAEKTGGMLRYGIPAYRLPDDILDKEIDRLEKLGITIRREEVIHTARDLLDDNYRAVFMAVGAPASASLNVPGEKLENVTGMLEFLNGVNAGRIKKIAGTAAIIGGGNSAIDAARCAVRLGADEVKIVYRRSREEMPAHDWEIEEAELEGVQFEFLAAPVEVLGNGGVASAVLCNRMKLGEPDDSGRRRPVPIEGDRFEVKADLVIPAIGQKTDLARLADGLETDKWNSVIADPVTQATNVAGVFAGGDLVTGAATVVEAFGAGKRAAESIDRYLNNKDMSAGRGAPVAVSEAGMTDRVERMPSARPRALSDKERAGSFDEVVFAFSEEDAVREATRCLGCGVMFETAVTGHPVRSSDSTVIVTLEVDREMAEKVAGVRYQKEDVTLPIETVLPPESDDDVVVCRCERVTLGEIRKAIRGGAKDMNELKATIKVGLGSCGGKTCGSLIRAVFRREGIPDDEVTVYSERPLVAEVPLGLFAGADPDAGKGDAR